MIPYRNSKNKNPLARKASARGLDNEVKTLYANIM
jgi:hypothetical protein